MMQVKLFRTSDETTTAYVPTFHSTTLDNNGQEVPFVAAYVPVMQLYTLKLQDPEANPPPLPGDIYTVRYQVKSEIDTITNVGRLFRIAKIDGDPLQIKMEEEDRFMIWDFMKYGVLKLRLMVTIDSSISAVVGCHKNHRDPSRTNNPKWWSVAINTNDRRICDECGTKIEIGDSHSNCVCCGFDRCSGCHKLFTELSARAVDLARLTAEKQAGENARILKEKEKERVANEQARKEKVEKECAWPGYHPNICPYEKEATAMQGEAKRHKGDKPWKKANMLKWHSDKRPSGETDEQRKHADRMFCIVHNA